MFNSFRDFYEECCARERIKGLEQYISCYKHTLNTESLDEHYYKTLKIFIRHLKAEKAIWKKLIASKVLDGKACPRCKHRLKEVSHYCPKCGQKLRYEIMD